MSAVASCSPVRVCCRTVVVDLRRIVTATQGAQRSVGPRSASAGVVGGVERWKLSGVLRIGCITIVSIVVPLQYRGYHRACSEGFACDFNGTAVVKEVAKGSERIARDRKLSRFGSVDDEGHPVRVGGGRHRAEGDDCLVGG